MARSNDPKKAAWRERRFRRFHDSGLPVARFCAAEHVSEASFYYWRKRLGPRKLGRLRRGWAMGVEDRAAGRGNPRAITENRNVFRPVTIVPATYGVVLRLPGGTRIDVDAEHLDAIRAVVAETMRVEAKQGGQIVNSEGQRDDKAWARRAAWVDYHGPLDGETVGIAILNHPSSFRYPTYWHVRTYGLFAANPFGVRDFTRAPGADGSYEIAPGKSLTLRYRVLLHRGRGPRAAPAP